MNLDFTGAFVAVGIACTVAGWFLIEGLIWLLDHVGLVWVA